MSIIAKLERELLAPTSFRDIARFERPEPKKARSLDTQGYKPNPPAQTISGGAGINAPLLNPQSKTHTGQTRTRNGNIGNTTLAKSGSQQVLGNVSTGGNAEPGSGSGMKKSQSEQALSKNGAIEDSWSEAIREGKRVPGAMSPGKLAKRLDCVAPGPGQYAWNADVNLNRPAKWSLTTQDRRVLDMKQATNENKKNIPRALDMKTGTWVPLSSSALAAAPAPGAYGDLSKFKPNGGSINPRKTDIGSSKTQRDLAFKKGVDAVYELPPVVGVTKHPTIKASPGWSLSGANRAVLSANNCGWLPSDTSNAMWIPAGFENPKMKHPGLSGNRHNEGNPYFATEKQSPFTNPKGTPYVSPSGSPGDHSAAGNSATATTAGGLSGVGSSGTGITVPIRDPQKMNLKGRLVSMSPGPGAYEVPGMLKGDRTKQMNQIRAKEDALEREKWRILMEQNMEKSSENMMLNMGMNNMGMGNNGGANNTIGSGTIGDASTAATLGGTQGTAVTQIGAPVEGAVVTSNAAASSITSAADKAAEGKQAPKTSDSNFDPYNFDDYDALDISSLQKLIKKQKRKQTGTFGGRPANLPLGVSTWAPMSYSQRASQR